MRTSPRLAPVSYGDLKRKSRYDFRKKFNLYSNEQGLVIPHPR